MSDFAMSPGRELDALVAEKVMGWLSVRKQSIANAMGQHVMDDYVGLSGSTMTIPQLIPRYSTMIQEAWKVAEELRGRSQFVAVLSGLGPTGVQPWICKINRDGGFIEERADVAPVAICLAALKSVGIT